MAGENEKLAGLYVEVQARTEKAHSDIENLKKFISQRAEAMELDFKKRKISFDDTLMKKKVSELLVLRTKFQAQFEKRVALDFDAQSIKQSRDHLNAVERALQGVVKEEAKVTQQKPGLMSWALGITAVNQAYQFLTGTFTQLKSVLSDAVRTSTQLEVLRANFKGSADDIELFRKATADTVSEANLIRLSNQASDLGISLKDQAILFSIAEDAADKYGTGVEEGMMKVILASEGNIRGLKAIGIQGKIYESIVKDLAKAHNDEINNLDADTQKQIRLQAIIKASGVTIEDVTNKTKDNADKIESLSVRVEEAKDRIGQLVSKGLLPLIDTFDKSGKTGKDFASITLGIGSVIFSLIPMLIQLKSAQALMATTTAASTTALEANSVALGTNAVAGAGWLSKFGIALLAGIGIAIGIGAGKLIDYIKYDLPEEMNKAAEDASNKLRTPPGFEDWLARFNKGERAFVENGKVVTVQVNVNSEKAKKSIDDLNKDIERWTTERGKLDFTKDATRIAELNKKIKDATTQVQVLTGEYKYSNEELDKTLKKISDENELKRITGKLTTDTYEETKRTLELMLNSSKVPEDQLKIYGAINKLFDDQLGKIQLQVDAHKDLTEVRLDALENAKQEYEYLSKIAITDEQRAKTAQAIKETNEEIKKTLAEINKNSQLKGKTPEGYQKQIVEEFYKPDRKEREQQIENEVKRIDIEKELRDLRIKSIDSEFARREAEIEAEFSNLQEHYKNLYDNKLISEDEFQKASFDLESGREQQLSDLQADRFSKALGATRQIANALTTVFHDSTFVNNLLKALDIAEAIAAVLQSINILGSLFSFGATTGASGAASAVTAITKAEGGVVANINGKPFSAPYQRVPKFASGTKDFIVPPGFPNDSFLMALTSGEKANITPVNEVARSAGSIGNSEKLLQLIAERVGAVSSNIRSLDLNVSITNNAPDVDTQVRKHKKAETKLQRAGLKFNEL